MKWYGNLAQIAIFLAGYENNVVAFAQRTHSKRGSSLVRTTLLAQRPSLEPTRVNLRGQTLKVSRGNDALRQEVMTLS
jgi:hypothetical protein